jgi:cyclomaltodextrin glucanotransferase
VLVLSVIGQKVQGQTVVRVQLNGVQTQPGQRVVIIGDCPELGNWDLAKALPPEYVNASTWFGEVAFNESAGPRCPRFVGRQVSGCLERFPVQHGDEHNIPE